VRGPEPLSALPKIHYARTADDASLAYWTRGEGDTDVLFLPGAATHAEAFWDLPFMANYFERLASLGRLISFDLRGYGMSDPIPNDGFGLDDQVADLVCILDAVGSKRALLLGAGLAGPLMIRAAVTVPDRVLGLVLSGTYARLELSDDYPIGVSAESLGATLDWLRTEWGSGVTIDLFAPSLANDPELRELWARFERLGASPGQLARVVGLLRSADVRSDLAELDVPTLVLHVTGDRLVNVEHGRYLAEHIDGAKYYETDGVDASMLGDGFEMHMLRIGELLSRYGSAPRPESTSYLTTLLYVDVVGSTDATVRLGDSAWRQTLDAFRHAVRQQLRTFDGNEIGTRGDDFLITFPRPTDAIRCAQAIRSAARSLGLGTRAGIHAGEVETQGADIAGLTAHIGARIAGLAGPGEILASGTVEELVIGSALSFTDRGDHTLRGIPRPWRVVQVDG
jgi:class 3 adenylate cyclase/pimeloyl-ACP methyl ester carboxylesterase